jgi:hypothetical protein
MGIDHRRLNILVSEETLNLRNPGKVTLALLDKFSILYEFRLGIIYLTNHFSYNRIIKWAEGTKAFQSCENMNAMQPHVAYLFVTRKEASLMAGRCKPRFVRGGNKSGRKSVTVKRHRRTPPVKKRCGK